MGHNLSFDLGYIWHDEQWQNYLLNEENTIWDTQEAEYILSGQRHKYASLAELQEIYLGQKIKEGRISRLFKRGIGADQILSRRNDIRRVFALYESYCRGDGISTLKIFAQQYRKAKELGMLPLIKARMKGLLAVLLMQNTGMHLDLNNVEVTLRDLKIKSIEYLEQATAIVTPMWDKRLGAFKINSPKQKSAILFGGDFEIKERQEDGLCKNGNTKYKSVMRRIRISGFGLGAEYQIKTKKDGIFATAAGTLIKILRHCKDPQVLAYCELQKKAMNYLKMCSTYLEPFLKFNLEGKLYPNYNTVGTETSRLSSSKPNLQNIPASGDMLISVQGQLIAPEGWLCADIDYGQLEPHVTALITSDKHLTEDLLNGVCLHCRAVSWIPRLAEGKTYEEIYQLAVVEKHPDWVLKRKKAKGINFKRAYGGGAKKLADVEELNIEDVKEVFASQEEYYFGVKEFNDALFNNLKETQKISMAKHFSKNDQKGRRFNHAGIELLPIFDSNGKIFYLAEEYRHYGSYRSPFGHVFTFDEVGQINQWGKLKRKYSTTQTKNYQIQGTAGDIVEAAMAECMKYVLTHKGTIQMVRQIHDSLGFYVKKGQERLHLPRLCRIIGDVKYLTKKYYDYEAKFNFPVECKIEKNFAEMEIYNESN